MPKIAGQPVRTLALTLAFTLAGALVAVSIGRLAAGGLQPSDFDGGVLIPQGASNWRGEWTLHRLVGTATSRQIVQGDPLPGVVAIRHVPGSDCCGGFAHPAYDAAETLPGVRCMVGGVPTLLERNVSIDRWTAHAVRDTGSVDLRDLPRFEHVPEAMPTHSSHWVLLDHGDGGSRMAVLADAWGTVDLHVSDVALLIRPPWIPSIVLVALLAVAFFLERRARTRARTGPALVAFATWMLVEAVVFALAIEAAYL